MPDNLEESHQQKQVNELEWKRRWNLFMRFTQINDDLWHEIRLELEI